MIDFDIICIAIACLIMVYVYADWRIKSWHKDDEKRKRKLKPSYSDYFYSDTIQPPIPKAPPGNTMITKYSSELYVEDLDELARHYKTLMGIDVDDANVTVRLPSQSTVTWDNVTPTNRTIRPRPNDTSRERFIC